MAIRYIGERMEECTGFREVSFGNLRGFREAYEVCIGRAAQVERDVGDGVVFSK